MKKLRTAAFVALIDFARLIAPRQVREVHDEIVHLGMTALDESLDSRISAHRKEGQS